MQALSRALTFRSDDNRGTSESVDLDDLIFTVPPASERSSSESSGVREENQNIWGSLGAHSVVNSLCRDDAQGLTLQLLGIMSYQRMKHRCAHSWLYKTQGAEYVWGRQVMYGDAWHDMHGKKENGIQLQCECPATRNRTRDHLIAASSTVRCSTN